VQASEKEPLLGGRLRGELDDISNQLAGSEPGAPVRESERNPALWMTNEARAHQGLPPLTELARRSRSVGGADRYSRDGEGHRSCRASREGRGHTAPRPALQAAE
jgi:hypothetical protein